MKTKFRKRLLLASVSLSLCSVLIAAEGEKDARQLAPGVYMWQGDRDKREPANSTLVLFKDYAVLIDGNFPWGARELLPKLRSLTDKPIRYLVNTHYHGDHSFGNSLYVDAGAAVLTSEATAAEMRTKGKRSWDNWKEPGHTLEGARLEPATVTYSDNMFLDDGTQRLELHRLGPGHSRGDTVAYLPKPGIVITGDLCVTWPYGNNVGDADADYSGWLNALTQMASWNPKIVVPGHGPAGDLAALQTQREYLSDMWHQVQTGIQAGKTADQLAGEINLTSHGTIASTPAANATSVRAMFSHLSKPR
jgi:cyclase